MMAYPHIINADRTFSVRLVTERTQLDIKMKGFHNISKNWSNNEHIEYKTIESVLL